MTRRHYVMLSGVFKALLSDIATAQLKHEGENSPKTARDLFQRHIGAAAAAIKVAEALAADNPRGFDKDRFLVDCGLDPFPER